MSDPKVTELLKQMETQVLMGHYAPEELSVIATNVMQMAAQHSQNHSTKKDKSEQVYFMALLLLHQLELEAAQLRLDIAVLNEELNEIRQQQSEIADLLNDIDDLIGEGGHYDRDSAIGLLEQITGKRPDDNMSDADIQALLKHEEAQLRAEQNDLEDRANIIEGKIAEKEHRLDEIEYHVQSLKQITSEPATSLEDLEYKIEEVNQLGFIQDRKNSADTNINEADNSMSQSFDSTKQTQRFDLNTLM